MGCAPIVNYSARVDYFHAADFYRGIPVAIRGATDPAGVAANAAAVNDFAVKRLRRNQTISIII